MSKKNFDTPLPDESMFEHGIEAAAIETPKYGTVTCERLNVRSEPKKDRDNASVLCVVNKGAKLLIDDSKSTVLWYAVTTPAGVEGYCMKKFVDA